MYIFIAITTTLWVPPIDLMTVDHFHRDPPMNLIVSYPFETRSECEAFLVGKLQGNAIAIRDSYNRLLIIDGDINRDGLQNYTQCVGTELPTLPE